MMMLNELSVVDRIERAHGLRPYCDCGRETIVVYRDGTVWLECAAIHEPVENRIVRIWKAVTPLPHVSEPIAEIDTPEELAA